REAAARSGAALPPRAHLRPRTVRGARVRDGAGGPAPEKAVSRELSAAGASPDGPSLSGDHAMRRLVASAMLITGATACATISTQQEVQMGQEYSQQINAQLPILQDAEINRYINVLGDSIAKVNDPRNLQWHFYVVDTKEVNAFAVPGGYIYVNRGLIEQADKMDQLAGVLGHEIGHVLNRHTVKLMEKENAANVGVQLGCILTNVCTNAAAGAAINVAGSAVFAKFSRQDEKEADESGVQSVTRAGIDPRGIPEMFQKLLDEESSSPGTLDAWFATHPNAESRIADTDAMIRKIDPVVLNSLTQDTPNFHTFKQRLQALPPSPPPKQPGTERSSRSSIARGGPGSMRVSVMASSRPPAPAAACVAASASCASSRRCTT